MRFILLTLISASAFALELLPTAIDPISQWQAAINAFVVGPAPAGYEPLFPANSGLSLRSAAFSGNISTQLSQTGIAYHRSLLLGGQFLKPGIFLSTGGAEGALAPDDAINSSWAFAQENADVLAEVMNGGVWNYSAQRLTLEFDVQPGIQSLRILWAFGTEEYPEYVGSSYNDVFGAFLFRSDERGPAGGIFSQAPTPQQLCSALYFQLTAAQQSFLVQHQIAFDNQGYPITVNGPFFSANSVVIPPLSGSEYDGSTPILETVAPLTPGATYSLYLIVADTDDTVYDSGVFLSIEGSGNPVFGTETLPAPPSSGSGSTSGNTGNSGNTANAGNSTNTGNTGNVANTGNSGNLSNTGNLGNTANSGGATVGNSFSGATGGSAGSNSVSSSSSSSSCSVLPQETHPQRAVAAVGLLMALGLIRVMARQRVRA